MSQGEIITLSKSVTKLPSTTAGPRFYPQFLGPEKHFRLEITHFGVHSEKNCQRSSGCSRKSQQLDNDELKTVLCILTCLPRSYYAFSFQAGTDILQTHVMVCNLLYIAKRKRKGKMVSLCPLYTVLMWSDWVIGIKISFCPFTIRQASLMISCKR